MTTFEDYERDRMGILDDEQKELAREFFEAGRQAPSHREKCLESALATLINKMQGTAKHDNEISVETLMYAKSALFNT